MKILVINAGSSSLKYQLFDMSNEKVLAKGVCERIGIDGRIKHTPYAGDSNNLQESVNMPTHADAILQVMSKLVAPNYGVLESMSEIDAVGHRVVHGGESFASSVLITDEVMLALDDCVPLAPLHNPANITGINACKNVMGDIPQVGVFDTAFHQTMPKKAYIYALPYKYYEQDKVRRYGFHGTSHRYLATRAAEMLGRPVGDLKIISCHIGNGSSICAINGGKSVDTSMGFTPLVGVPMGTRCGDIDPSILQFLMSKYNIDIDEMLNILNKESGVLGISGLSSDFRDLEDAIEVGNPRAILSLDIFNYNIAKVIGSYVAAMNGVDAILFSAGIGENSPETRAEICEHLGYLGTNVDHYKNKVRGKEAVISSDTSKVKLMVVPTNEELVIARDTKSIVDEVFGKDTSVQYDISR